MLSVKKWAIAKLLWFIEDSAQELDKLLKYPLQKSYREYVSFCRNKIQMEGNVDMKRNQARSLCQLLGFIGSSPHNGAFSASPIVQAVQNGASSHDVHLLLVAGFDVDSTCPDGNSLLCIAVRFGYLHVAETLVDKRANVNFANTKDGKRTPVMFAAAHGHLHCLQLLLQNGAKASKEGYEVAMQNGHISCATLLQKTDSSCAAPVAEAEPNKKKGIFGFSDAAATALGKHTMLTATGQDPIQYAATHDFPNEDLSNCGPENGWPQRLFGKVRSEKLIGVGIKTFTRLRAVVGSMTKAQFYEAYGTHDGVVGALDTGADAMWEVVTAWELAHAIREVEPSWLNFGSVMPDEDLSLGAEGGWPPGAMGPARIEKLKSLGITRTSQLMMQALSMSYHQFVATYGSKDGALDSRAGCFYGLLLLLKEKTDFSS
jgi:hypothetical protein